MTEEDLAAADDSQADGAAGLRDADGQLAMAWLEQLRALLEAGDPAPIKAAMAPLHAADAGDILEALTEDERAALVNALGAAFDYEALTEVDESVRTDIMDTIPNADIARGVAELDSDDAVAILEDLEEADREDVLARLPAFERLRLRRSLDYPEESAGRRMQTDFIAIPPFWTVGQTIDYMRAEPDLPEEFFQLYVVDPAYKLLGTVPLDRLLRSKRDVKIDELMNTQLIEVDATDDQEEAAHVFERYDLVEVGVVDDSGRLVGVLTIDDMVDVINEEVGEDIKRLAGVGDEDISDSAMDSVRSRAPWLLVNLVTAVLVSMVIGFFDATIEQMVALAVLMPIVASMGGNAGNQTMTITVRALATRDLDRHRIGRLITRELIVGLVNGVLFAVLVGLVTWWRFGNFELGIVIGLAMVMNLVVAGGSGILIPLILKWLKADPAIASTVFVTTITDVFGFFAFLLLAALWFGLF